MSNPRDWEDLASGLDGGLPSDFETTAYRLVAEQVIYHSDRSSRAAYGILGALRARVLQSTGAAGYYCRSTGGCANVTALRGTPRQLPRPWLRHCLPWCCAVWHATKACVNGTYRRRRGACATTSAAREVPPMTGRDLPTRSELDTLLRSAKRWGIAQRLEDDDSGHPTPCREQSMRRCGHPPGHRRRAG